VIGLIKSVIQDVLMLQGGFHFASAAANVRKHPTWWLRAGAWLGQRCSLTYWSYRLLERRQLAATPLVVVPSNWVARQAQSRSYIDPTNLRVVPNAIASERLLATDRPRRRTTLREQLGLAPEHVAGLFCGHNYRLKGLAPLLAALAAVPNPDLHLLVCGDPRVRRWRYLAETLGLQHRVHFLGFVPDVRDAYFAADFLDRKSTRLNPVTSLSRMPSSA
jgi:UDP-glucose:(heptosyl)LPS alpha-1,3-glucosyltransferase